MLDSTPPLRYTIGMLPTNTLSLAETQTLHAESLILASRYASEYAKDSTSPKTYALLEAYKAYRRLLPKENGHRYGCSQAYMHTRN